MKPHLRNKDWSEFMVTVDRISRVFSDFISPVLIKYEAESVSLSNILFLMSIGEGEHKVSEIVRKGRYGSSNATYVLKALLAAELIARRQDAKDRRNILVSWTEKGKSLVKEIRENSTDITGYCKESWEILTALENHCARRIG